MSGYSPRNDALREFIAAGPQLRDVNGAVIPSARIEDLLVFAMGSAPVSTPPWGIGIRYVKIPEVMDLTREELIEQALAFGEDFDPLAAYRFAKYVLGAWEDTYRYGNRLWILWAVGLIGRDMIVLELMECFERHKLTKRREILSIIRELGTDMTYAVMQDLGDNNWFAHKDVYRFIDKMAARDGLKREAWLDRHVPMCGLSKHGRGELQCGAHHFTLMIDDALEPMLRDDQGNRYETFPEVLPDASNRDIMEAALLWRLARRQTQTVLPTQIRRLEEAMVEARSWGVDQWRALFLEHPVMKVLAEHVLWGIFDAEGAYKQAFRVASDATLADVEDDLFELPEDTSHVVRVLHPAHLEKEAQFSWSEVFVDYENIELFPQLGRRTWRAAQLPERADEIELSDYDEANGSLFYGVLSGKGWKRKKQGRRVSISKTLYDLKVTVIGVAPLRNETVWTFKEVKFRKRGTRRDLVTLSKLPPVAFSELLRDWEFVLTRYR